MVGSKRLLRNVLRRAGVDDSVRNHFWLPASWSDFALAALLFPALFLSGTNWSVLLTVTMIAVIVWPQLCHRTMVVVGDSQFSVVESSRVTVLSPSAELLVSRTFRQMRSKLCDVAISDGESRWSGRLANNKELTTLEAEWERLGLHSEAVVALH